uniref:CSON009808 protein n=1 Tax=Culicoides sonorensis TaxID=179676 RepID=A0A336M0P0_CULSO
MVNSELRTIMVNISYQQENTTCDISKKNILRRDSDSEWDKMGNQHGHDLHVSSISRATDVLEVIGCAAKEKKTIDDAIKRYDPDDILALRENPISKVKPTCADDRPFWIDGKPYVAGLRAKRMNPNQRIGSGRINSIDKFQSPTILSQNYDENNYQNTNYHQNNNNYYRTKTGREFCENMNNNNNNQRQGDPSEYKVSFFNPVNRDHRRLLREKSEENLPEWVNAGPKSRFDTIDLHGFHDDPQNNNKKEDDVKSIQSCENKENHHDKSSGKSFSFDEFLGSSYNGHGRDNSVKDMHHYTRPPPSQFSRFKTHFNNKPKNRDFNHHFNQNQYNQPPPGFGPIQKPMSYGSQHQQFQPKFDSNNNNNNNNPANALLELLHRHGNMEQQHQGFKAANQFTNMSFMPSATELESHWRQGKYSDVERQKLLEHNKAILAGKSIVDVLDVLTQSKLRANAMSYGAQQQQYHQNQHNQYQQQQNQWSTDKSQHQFPSSIMKNNQINKFQMARVLERQMKVQGHNPMYGGLTPQDPEYWEKIRQQQQAFYQQYERQNRTVKAKFPGQQPSNPHQRRVKFEEQSKLEHFFNNHNMTTGNLPTIDPNKAIKVEEFERKIKQVAASVNKPSSHDYENNNNN